MAKLILREDGSSKEVSLDDKGSVTIGRSPDCDLPITDSQASRRHCSVVRLQSGAYEVADLGSTNGTLLNSTLIKKQRMKHGDVIRIGAAEIVYDDPSAAAEDTGADHTCSLVYAKGPRKGQKLALTEQRTTIGRKASNTIPLEDPVCSSYHCEIVRDLNGYTIRDLGSTNGTLVNSEMITEAQLIHGARIRIGNTRLVFQDPAMAEVDLELAGVEDDEPEWGMMRELDLAAVRRRNPATFVYLGLFVAIIGALGYLLTLDSQAKGKGFEPPEANLHEPFEFESQASRFAWRSEPAGVVRMTVSGSKKARGESSLELRSGEATATAFYNETLRGSQVRYRLEAKVAASGATARLGILWTGLGLERWSLADPVSGGFTDVKLECSSPPWATRARLGVRIEGGGAVNLDSVTLVTAGAPSASKTELNDFVLTVTDGRSADLSHAGAPILVNGRGFGDAGPATIRAEKADEEHIKITVSAEGAAKCGIEFQEVGGYLSRGGFRAFTPGQEKTFHAAFPDEGSLALEGVRKLLLGPPGRAFAALGAGDDATLQTVATVDGRERRWRIEGPAAGGSFSFRFKVNLRGETKEAGDRMASALDLHNQGRWGEFLDEAGQALAEFPFASKAMRNRLSKLISDVNGEYVRLANDAERNLADYKEFKDLQSLDNVRAILDTLASKFQVKAGQGQRGQRFKRVADDETKLRAAALKKRQGEIAGPIMDEVQYIFLPEGEDFSAAVRLAYVVHYLPDSPQAATARAELDKLVKKHAEIPKVLDGLGLKGSDG